MKKTLFAVLAAVLLPVFAFADTGSIVQSGTFSYIPTNSVDLTFNKFDAASIASATGATNISLSSVTITLTITKLNGSIQVDNDAATSADVTLTQTVTVTLKYNGSTYITDLAADSSVGASLEATSGDSTTAFNSTGASDYFDSGLFSPVSTSTTETVSSTSGYTGTGTYIIKASATQDSNAGSTSGVSVAYSPATVTGTVTVTYNYSYTAVPEPSTWAMMFGGIGALVVVQRMRRREHRA